MPNAMVTYKKPPSLRTALVNAKELAYETTNQVIPGTFACGSCALCGNFGRYKGHNMILEDGMVRVSSTGKRLRLHQRLTCRNFGIYLATCIIDNCGKQYVGQTKNSFRERWGGHRSQWKKSATSDTDAAALNNHFRDDHSRNNTHKPEIYDAFRIQFLQQPSTAEFLDQCEDIWDKRITPALNIQRMVTPRFK